MKEDNYPVWFFISLPVMGLDPLLWTFLLVMIRAAAGADELC